MQLPEQLQYKQSPQFVAAAQALNQALIEASEKSKAPITGQQALAEVTLPLFNLFAQFTQTQMSDVMTWFLGLGGYLYDQQQQAADDNIILAVDPDLAEEVSATADSVISVMRDTKDYIEKVNDWLKSNKPEKYEGKDKEELKKNAEKLEEFMSLREDYLRIMSGLQQAIEDIDAMANAVDSAVYEPESPEEEEEEEQPPPREPYNSIVGD